MVLAVVAVASAFAGTAAVADPVGLVPLGPVGDLVTPQLLDRAESPAYRHDDDETSTAERSSSAVRSASRTKFTDLDRSDIAALAGDTFDDVLDEATATGTPLDAGLNVVQRVGPFGEALVGPDGERTFVTSTSPLSAVEGSTARELDLDLEHGADGWQPEVAATDVTLPDTLGDGVALDDLGIKIGAASTSSVQGLKVAGQSSVAYPDAIAGGDADFLAAPVAGGIETFIQVRSAQAAESAHLQLELPAGAELRGDATSNSARIIKDGDVIADIVPPTGQDAAGKAVEVTLHVEGTDLVLAYPHRGEAIEYPLLIDPLVIDHAMAAPTWQAQATDSTFTASTSCISSLATSSCGRGYGMYMYKAGNVNQSSRSFGQWVYSVPHATVPGNTARVVAFTASGEVGDSYGNNQTNPILVDGILDSQKGQWAGPDATHIAAWSRSITTSYLGTPAPGRLEPPYTNGGGLSPGNIGAKNAIIALDHPSAGAYFASSWIYAGAVSVEIGDTDGADVTVGTVPTTYQSAPFLVHATATDNGLGVYSFTLFRTTGSGDVQVDNYSPQPGQSGYCDATPAHVCATSVQHDMGIDPQSSAYSAGVNHLKLCAYDLSVNAPHSCATFDVNVAKLARRVDGEDRIGLEKFWDYDATDTGAGSQLMVNSDTGNVIWHDVPIVNPGRGLSTFVNLDYNSLENPPALGASGGIDPLAAIGMGNRLAYNAAGRGISLSVSGPTRLNQPLAGLGLADVRDGIYGTVTGLPANIGNDIALTDADGTTHHFTRDASNANKWIAPPGVHLTLRRFASTGDPLNARAWVMTRPDGVAYFFNRLGYLIETQDRVGNKLSYTYDKLDLLTGATGAAASACSAATTLGGISGTPSAANGWGLQTLLAATTSSATGRLCALQLTKVTDAGQRDLTLSYQSRPTADQQRLTNALTTAFNGGSITVQTLLSRTSTALADLGILAAPPKLASITDHASRQYAFDYKDGSGNDTGDLTSLVEVANAGSLAPAGDSARRWKFVYAADDGTGTHRLTTVREVLDPAQPDAGPATTIHYATRGGTPAAGYGAAAVPDKISDRRSKATAYVISAYGATPRRLTVIDPRSKAWKRDVDGFGRPTQITDPLSNATTLSWDNGTPRRNDLLRVADGVTSADAGSVTTMTYEPMSGLLATQTTYPDGESSSSTARTTELNYAISSGAAALRPGTDPNSNFVADLTDVKQPRTLSGGAHVGWKYEVDTPTGEVTSRQDQDGGPKALTTYCASTDLQSICPTGSIKTQTDEVGNTTSYTDYDANGLPRTVVDPKGNAPGASASQHRWLYRYDAVGNLLSSSDPRNSDAQANPTVATPAARYTTKFTYDAFDRAVAQVTPKKSSTDTYINEAWTYDRNGNVLTNSNAGTGRSTTATFSTTDQPLTVTRAGWTRDTSSVRGNAYTPRNEVATFSYDDTDLLVSRTDPRGASGVPSGGGNPNLPYTTEWTRDDAGRVVAETRHATSTIHVQSFALDPRGNVVGQIDSARNADPDGTPSTSDSRTPTAAATAAAAAVSSGNLSGLRVSRAYNHTDEVVSETERPAPSDTTGSPRTNRYVYDADGNVVKHILPRDDHDVPTGFTSGAGNVANTYTYDHRDQVLTVTDPTGAVSAVRRRADGKVTSQTTPRGVANGATNGDGSYTYYTTSYVYDAAGDLLTRSTPYAPNQYGRPGTANRDYLSWKVTYGRDAVGNPTTIEDGRGKTVTNDFFDNGQLRSTSRPSWWQLDWGQATGAPDPGRRFTDPASSEHVPVGGPQLVERDTPLTGADTSADQPDTTADGKFGAVTPADAPDWMPRGGATLFDYDDDGHLTTITDAALATSRIDYDPTGRVVGTTQPLGASAGPTRTSGDPAPCVRTAAGCDGVIARRYDYDLDGDLTKSSLLGDAAWHSDFSYDSFDRMVGRSDPGRSDVPTDWSAFSDSREQTQYAYDANDNLDTRVTPRGVESPAAGDYEYRYDYDTLDRLVLEVNPEGDTWCYAWDVDDNLLRELTPNGTVAPLASQNNYKTLRTYDAADRLATEQSPIVGGVRNTSTFTYFPDGTMASRTDPGATATDGGADVARLTTYDYDGRGLRNRMTQGHAASSGGGFSTAGLGPRTTLTEYDANSNLRRVVDPSGVTMTGSGAAQAWAPANPDAIGDNLTSTASTDAVHATVYDYTDRINSATAGEAGEPTAIYQPRSNTGDSVYAEKVDYDPLDRVQTIWTVDNVNASGAFSVHTSYNRLLNGWISGAQDFATPTTQINSNTYNYDQNGSQLSWRLDPDVTTTTNKISKIDREYWPNGQMKTRTGSALVGSTTSGTPRSYSYWYDPNDGLTGVHDPDPAHSRTVYIDRDGAERTTSVVQRYGTGSNENAGTDPWQRGRDSAFSYDRNGNVTSRRANGTLNRSDSTMADPATGSPYTYARFTYDLEDKETIGAFYEPTKLTGTPSIDDSTCAAGGSPPAGVRCVRTTYHPSGQRRTRRQQNDTLVTTYVDDFDQPTERRRKPTGGTDIVTSYTYDIRGNRLSDTPGEGNYTYNARNQLTQWKRGSDFNANGVNHKDWTIDYTRNTDGSIEHTTEKQDAASGGALVRTKTYSYTGQRLDTIKTTLPSGGTPSWDVYGYNEFRSIVGVQSGVSAATAPTFAVPAAVRSEDCSQTLPATGSDTTLYCYDEFDRLTRQRSPGAGEQQQFEYDGMDRRDNRTDHIGATTDKSGYKYIGATSSLSGQQVATGATTSSLVSYDRDSANHPLAVRLQTSGSSTQTIKTYATDANGNPTGLENTDGSVPAANRYVYDPYGDLDTAANAATTGDAATNPLRFNGFDYDSAVKTYDMQARDYRPDVGRFLQNDRYESAQSDLSLIADPLTQNRYDFAGADPVSNVEFDGHISPDSVDRNNDVAAKPENNPSRGPIKPVSHVERAHEIPQSTQQIHKQQPLGQNDARTDGYEKQAAPRPKRSFVNDALTTAAGQLQGAAEGVAAATQCAPSSPQFGACLIDGGKQGADNAAHPIRTFNRGTTAVGDTAYTYTHGSPGQIFGRVTADVVIASLTRGAGKLAQGERAITAAKAAPEIKAGVAGGETAGKAFPQSVRQAALDENPSTCVFCRMETDSPQVDHAIPRARGGDATIENAQTSCPHCNASKGARDNPVNPPPGYRGPWPPPWWRP